MPDPTPDPVPDSVPQPSPDLDPKTGISTATKTKSKDRSILLKPGQPTMNIEGKKIPRKGSIAWRQGILWVVIWPPYRQKNIIWTDEKPPGIRVAKGPDSAFKTITRLGGRVPKNVGMELGMFDVGIRDGKTLRFTRRLKGVRA